ncbi:hypothetical protein [Bosea sp. MMO-172]|uniref:hypothetical protein n=1 Tax=Bosea sp. MMO-172 TaxID=3127885 RepID=UPI003015A720
MHTGKGHLILRDGRRLPLTFQFGSDYDDMRAGYLLCDTSGLDAGALLDRLKVCCDDGTDIIVAVMHSSDRYLAVTGRLLPVAA